MDPVKRQSRGTKLLDHENRIDTLERRIPSDYPIWASALLDNTGNLTGPIDHPFSFTFPDECSDPTGLECEDIFVTSGDWLLFPTGWGFAPYWVSLIVDMLGGGGNIHNMYTMATPGAIGETDEVALYIEMAVWRDNAPFGTVSDYGFVIASQTPPRVISTQLADRSWSLLTLMPGHGIIDRTRDRFAVRSHILLDTGAGPSTFEGQIVVGLMPPDTGIIGAFGF